MPKIDSFFKFMVENKASDLHISSGTPPKFRIDGSIASLDFKSLTHDEAKFLIYEILTDKTREHFDKTGDTDFSYAIEGLARFRGNVFMQQRGIAAVFRRIPEKILSVKDLNLPETVLQFTHLNKGLVLVTGATGSGKSTTLAALIDHINNTREDHIITLEDPIEFVHQNKKCLINQREIHHHTESFSTALRAALREDPDIILVGELRDLETIELAITAAETGHLVFGTLHTSSAPKTIDRIIDVFSTDKQQQIRTMLSETLKGVIAQNLLSKVGGGRVAALEIMVCNSAIANLIRESKTFQIKSTIQTGKGVGMQTMDQALYDLAITRKVSVDEATGYAEDKTIFKALAPERRPDGR